MDEQQLCKRRLLDLSRQADSRQIVTFSGFLNLNEQNIFHSLQRELYTKAELSGGYGYAERQMVAFIPDALYYEWDYPIRCMEVHPLYPKFAEEFSHRDVLGAIMHLGIDRSRVGDILCQNKMAYVFCEEGMSSFLKENLTQIRHTMVSISETAVDRQFSIQPELEERSDMISSNRIDAVIAKAFRLSRSEAVSFLSSEKVFINGKCVTGNATPCDSGSIVSVRGKGRFIFETDQAYSKKGKLMVRFLIYR